METNDAGEGDRYWAAWAGAPGRGVLNRMIREDLRQGCVGETGEGGGGALQLPRGRVFGTLTSHKGAPLLTPVRCSQPANVLQLRVTTLPFLLLLPSGFLNHILIGFLRTWAKKSKWSYYYIGNVIQAKTLLADFLVRLGILLRFPSIAISGGRNPHIVPLFLSLMTQ